MVSKRIKANILFRRLGCTCMETENIGGLSERMANRCSVSEENAAWPVCVCWLDGLRAEESPDSRLQTELHSSDSTASTVSCGPTSVFSRTSLPSLRLIMMTCVLFCVVTLCFMAAAVGGKERWACIMPGDFFSLFLGGL